MPAVSKPALLVLGVLIALAPRCSGEDLFADRVAPIFQQHCLSCHNSKDQKGEFSLETAQQANVDGFIEAGDAAASHLMDVLRPTDGKAQMPKGADHLSDDELAVIERWINEGASWPEGLTLQPLRVTDFDWWSYQPVIQPMVPQLKDSWIRNPIDAFVLRKLNEKGLVHSEQADRRTLIRRLTFDLIGLPPTPEEVESFVNDSRSDAYERLVDRLLDSRHYGERWARHWLDVVKYADTCGYDKDKLRPNAWPYRDYVIRSLNQDKPYWRFIQEQIAGDKLFPGEPDGILGLGFIAAGPWDFIGHVEVSEAKIDGKVARNLDRDDMVTNTMNAFCSITVQCARCHNHKFDPITQQHYYGLQSIFAAVDRAERTYDLDPAVEEKRTSLKRQLATISAKQKKLADEISQSGGERLNELNKLRKELQAKVSVKKDAQFGYHSQIAQEQTTEKWVEVQLESAAKLERIVLRPCHDEYNDIGAGFGFPIRFKVQVATETGELTTVFESVQNDFTNPGLMPLSIEGLSVEAKRIRVTASKLASRKNDFIFALAEVQAFDSSMQNVALKAGVMALDSIEAPVRWSRNNLTDGRWAEAGNAELAAKLAKVNKEHAELLAVIETPERLKRRDELRAERKLCEDSLNALPKGKMVYAAATHFDAQGQFKPTQGKLRPVHVLHRGNIQQPGDPAVPGVLPLADTSDHTIQRTEDEAERRAALAKWLTDREHPLVWRSIVNRVWQYHFGQGIVATPNDFGRMGATPTHPELLDWLAVQFRDGGQSLKQLHRLIVTSNTYRQASLDNADNSVIDGSNQYLWRANRRRISAEEIRDSILSVSNSLNTDMGGPGFYLFKLEKTAHSPHYEYHKFDPTDPASHRRTIYRFIVRSQPDPWMTTLDCADSSQSTPRRNETLTALQALSLLNNRFNLVMADRFAKRLESESAELPAQVRHAFRLVAQRDPNDTEQAEMVAYAKTHGLTNLCRFLFNLSEFVYLD